MANMFVFLGKFGDILGKYDDILGKYGDILGKYDGILGTCGGISDQIRWYFWKYSGILGNTVVFWTNTMVFCALGFTWVSLGSLGLIMVDLEDFGCMV